MNSLDHANLYVTEWNFAVFPVYWIEDDGECACPRRDRCHNPGKHPITADGFKSATRDLKQIERWWKVKYPRANIGIATGPVSNIVVLDVDPRHGGFESLAAFSLPELEQTMKCRTGGGGEHYYFRYPADVEIRNSAGKLGPGLDVRGSGGYVVAPPSNHLKGVYEWERWETMAEWPFECSAGVPPAVGLASRQSATQETAAGRSRDCRRDAGATEGQRNTTLASLAGTMRRRGFSTNAIMQALLVENEERCQPPLERTEVAQIAQSIGKYESGASGESRASRASSDFPAHDAPDSQNSQDAQDFKVWNLSEFLSYTFEKKETICFEVGRGDVAMVSAKTNGGKSTLLRNCLLQLAIGREFAPFVPAGQAPRRVMLLDFESDAADLQRDLQTMTAMFSAVDHDLLSEHFHLVPKSMFGGMMLQMTEHFDLIKRLILAYASEVVVIDNISSAFEVADENSNAEMTRKVVKPLTRLAMETGAAVVFAHHIGKAAENSRDDYYQGRGASTLSCLAKSGFILKGRVDQGEPAEIACVKQKHGQNFSGIYRLDPETRWFTATGTVAPARKPTNYDLIVAWVRENSSPDKPVKTAEILAAFPQVSRATAMNKLNEAVSNDVLAMPRKGHYFARDGEEMSKCPTNIGD